MATYRYWRVVNMEAYDGGALSISELQLHLDGVRVDAGATITSTVAPVSGTLASLQDDSAAVAVTWDAASVRASGFAILFDLGAGVSADVNMLRVGGGGDRAAMLSTALLQYSLDGVIYDGSVPLGRFPWPGPFTLNPAPGPSSLFNSETFASGIPAGYASVLTDSSTLVATWSAAAQAVDLEANGYNAAWMLDAFAPMSGLRIEYDAEILVGDLGNNGMIGVAFKGGPQILQNLFGHTKQSIASLRSNGPDTLGLAEYLYDNTSLSVPLPTSGIHTYAASSKPNSEGTRDYSMTVDGVGVSFTLGHTASTAMLTGGLYVRSCKVRIHAVRVYSLGSGSGMLAVPRPARPVLGLVIPPVQSVSAFRMRARFADLVRARDMEHGGRGRVRGVTLDYTNPLNRPISCRVRLVRELDGLQVREQWSGADGTYDFQNIDEQQSYSVLAYYLDHGKRAEVADGLTLANGKVERMP